MARTTYLSFGNLTCRFGDVAVMMDFAQEIVLPALFNEQYERRHGLTTYFFRNVGLADIAVDGAEENQLTIYGRIIKNTVLTRTQVYSREEGLVADEGSLESAPSAFFALDLNNHKLMFLPETPFAPTMPNFASTLQSFVRRETDSYVRAQHTALQVSGQSKSFRELRETYPPADVVVTPLAGEANVADFIATFSLLERVEFKFLSTNAEIQQDDNFRRIRAMKDGVQATTTRLVHENKKGLNKVAVTEEAAAAAVGGNQKVLLKGLGEDGAVLKGNNDDLKLQVAMTDAPESLFSRAVAVVRSYANQVTSGRLKPDAGRPPQEKLTAIRESLGDRIERG